MTNVNLNNLLVDLILRTADYLIKMKSDAFFFTCKINKYAFGRTHYLTDFVKERAREAMNKFGMHTFLFLRVYKMVYFSFSMRLF